MKSAIKNLKRGIRGEMKDIASEYRVSGWNFQRVERMSPDEAFNRGYYRALQGILKALKRKLPRQYKGKLDKAFGL